MTLKQISGLGRKLAAFLLLFDDCFRRPEGRALLAIYVKGLLSDLHRKTAEAIALCFGAAPRTLQRFLESIKWDEQRMRNRCQQIVASQQAHPRAVGVIDESGVIKSGPHTVGVQRQWCGRQGKVDNCVVGVHLSYAAPGFQCLLDSAVYLPEAWANDSERRKKTTYPTTCSFAPSLRSHWNSSIARWPTASEWRLGRSTSFTVATTNSWTVWKSASRCLWRRFRWLFTDGCDDRTCCLPARKADPRSIRAWRVAMLRAKSGIWPVTRPCFGIRDGSGIG
jgi:hypothetical protein